MTALRVQLRKRGTDTEASIQKRLAAAVQEIEYAKQPNVYDVVIVNDDYERAYQTFKSIALGQQARDDRLPPLDD